MTHLVIHPRRLAFVLAMVVSLLTLMSLSVMLARTVFGHGCLFGISDLVFSGEEMNIPTWYSSAALLVCSALFFVIASAHERNENQYILHWRVLGVLFLLLSVDEACAMHEVIGTLLQKATGYQVFAHYGWVLPGALLTVLVSLAFVPFVRSLRVRTRRLLVLSAFIYTAGVLGAEAIGRWWDTVYGVKGLGYGILVVVEEFLEMSGVALCAFTLALYIADHVQGIRIDIEQPADRGQAP